MVSRRRFLWLAAIAVTGCLGDTEGDGGTGGSGGTSSGGSEDVSPGSGGLPPGLFRASVNGSGPLFDDSDVNPESVAVREVGDDVYSVSFGLDRGGVERFERVVSDSGLDSDTPVTLRYRNETVFRGSLPRILLRRVRSGDWSGRGLSVTGLNLSRARELAGYLSG